MGKQRIPFSDIWDTIIKSPHSLLERMRIRKRNIRERKRAQEDQVPILKQVIPIIEQSIPIIEQAIPIIERLIPIKEQLFKNNAPMETIKQSEGKIPTRVAIKKLKKSNKKKGIADINLTVKPQRKRVKFKSTLETHTKSMRSVQDTELPPLNTSKENVIPIITSNNTTNNKPKINNEKLPQPLLKMLQNKPLMKTVALRIPAKKAIKNKSSIEKKKTSNPKSRKNAQSHSTSTKPSKKERPKTLIKKSVQQKNSKLKPLRNQLQYTDEYIYSILDDL